MNQYIQELAGFGLEGIAFGFILTGGWGWFSHLCLLDKKLKCPVHP
jgi:hypothetical protein